MFSKLFKRTPQKEVNSAAVISEHAEDLRSSKKNARNLDSSYYSDQFHNNNASFSNNLGTPLETKQSDADFADKIPLNQNFSSIFNVPKQNSAFFNQLYQSLANSIKESMEMPSWAPKSLENFDISLQEFQNYTTKIKSSYDSYKKLRKLKEISHNPRESHINSRQSLLDCYENIPKSFFAESFTFDFGKVLSRETKKLSEFQDELYDYLDDVELNLSYQIKANFQDFMDIMINMNTIEVEINEALKNIAFLKKYHKNLRNIYTYTTKISALKVKTDNMEKVFELLKLMKAGLLNHNYIKEKAWKNINRQELLAFIAKIKKSAEIRRISSINAFHAVFKEFKRKYVNEIVDSFNKKSVLCLEKSFLYVKNSAFSNSGAENEPLSMDESFYNISSMNESFFQDYGVGTERNDENIRFLWTIPELGVGQHSDLKELAQIFGQYLSLKSSFPFESYSKSIYEILAKLHKKFWLDLSESFPEIVKQKVSPKPSENEFLLKDEISLSFCFKIISFLSHIFKRVLERQLFLNMSVVTYFNENAAISEEKVKTLRIIDGLELSIKSSLEFICNNLIETLDFIHAENMSLLNFRQMRAIFEAIGKWMNFERFKEMMLGTLSNNSQILDYFFNSAKHFQQFFGKLALFQQEKEKSFFQAFSRKSLNLVKAALENESWTPCDIPYIYLHFVALLCDFQPQFTEKELFPSADFAKTNRITNYLNETNNSEDEKEFDFEALGSPLSKSRENAVKIMKNELFIEENKFMVGNSTLVLIKCLYDLLLILQISPENRTETVTKLFEIIKFYNSYTCQLILGAGAIVFEKLKAISVKVLAFSSLLLSFVGFLFAKMGRKIARMSQLDLDNEISKLNSDIRNYLYEINLKIINILNEKLVSNCESIKSLEWHNKSEKLNIPTKFSAQILANTKQIFVNIEEYYTKDNLKAVFQGVLADILTYYVGTFEKIAVENKTAAGRIKEELEYFYGRLTEISIVSALEDEKARIYEKIRKIIRNNCDVYLEMTAIN